MHFKGNRLQSDHPDFYGLEEIKISDIHNNESPKTAPTNSGKDYRFNKSILWIFLIIIPVLGILYVAYTQQELLFGQKSFDKATPSVQTRTHRIEKDTAKARKIIPPVTSDSLKKDTVAQQNIQPAAKKAVASPATINNTKKKWQK